MLKKTTVGNRLPIHDTFDIAPVSRVDFSADGHKPLAKRTLGAFVLDRLAEQHLIRLTLPIFSRILPMVFFNTYVICMHIFEYFSAHKIPSLGDY